MTAYNQLGPTDYQRHNPENLQLQRVSSLSDRTYARYGTMTSPFERFSDWNDPDDPDKTVANRLDLMQRLMLNRETLLDIIQNYLEYESDGKRRLERSHSSTNI